jgi:hypothetical protein
VSGNFLPRLLTDEFLVSQCLSSKIFSNLLSISQRYTTLRNAVSEYESICATALFHETGDPGILYNEKPKVEKSHELYL